MTSQDRRKFNQILVAIAEIFNRQLSAISLDLYFEALKDLDFEDVNRAANIVARTCKFFPKPVEFREQVLPNLDAMASLAYDRLHESYLRYAPYHSVAFDDPIIHAVVNSLGGWVKLGSITIEEAKWYRKDFEAKYKQYAPQIRSLNIPLKLVGQVELDNTAKGYEEFIKPPMLIGDSKKVLAWQGERKALQAQNVVDIKALAEKKALNS